MKRQNMRRTQKGRQILPETPMPTIPLTEIADNRRVLIEHHKGIEAYGCHEIRVKVKNGYNCVEGSQLELHCISSEKIVITGHITCIRFCREV